MSKFLKQTPQLVILGLLLLGIFSMVLPSYAQATLAASSGNGGCGACGPLGTPSVTVVLPIPSTAGQTLIVQSESWGNVSPATSVLSVTDNAGNIFTSQGTALSTTCSSSAPALCDFELWSAPVTIASISNEAVTVTYQNIHPVSQMAVWVGLFNGLSNSFFSQATMTNIASPSISVSTPSGGWIFGEFGADGGSWFGGCNSITGYSTQYQVSVYGQTSPICTTNTGGTIFQATAWSFGTTSTMTRTTSTSVSCSVAFLTDHHATPCTATVTDTSPGTPITPSGTVTWTSSGQGTFSPNACALSGAGPTATCTVTYTASPGRPLPRTITGTYSGDTDHFGSSGTTHITTP